MNKLSKFQQQNYSGTTLRYRMVSMGLLNSLVSVSTTCCGLYLLPTYPACSSDFANMPHPLRIEAKGKLVFFVPVMIFVDDVSGNVSKQWNKHFVCYSSNGSLPREYLDKESNVRFVSASPNVNPVELFQGIRESFECVFSLLL
jgi:hypothetical protein